MNNRKMTRYIALLRGINISGKNKISMSELKTALIEKGFSEVFGVTVNDLFVERDVFGEQVK